MSTTEPSRRDAETPRRDPWLVTGATGFLGGHLLEQLARETPPHQVTPFPGDITKEPVDLPDRIGGIVHLAALVRHGPEDAERVMAVNLQGTLAMIRLAARYRCRMLFVSTSGTVGCFRAPEQIGYEESPFCEAEVRRWPYYRSKIEAERQGRALAEQLGVELVIARPPILLGPGDHRHRSSAHVKRLMDGKVPFVVDGGMHFADVRDVAAALIRIMRLPAPRPIYHLPGIQCSIAEFYRQVGELAGVRRPRGKIPYRLAWSAAMVSAKLHLHLLPEPTLVEMAAHFWGMGSRYSESELGYRTRPGTETLRDTIEWLRANPA